MVWSFKVKYFGIDSVTMAVNNSEIKRWAYYCIFSQLSITAYCSGTLKTIAYCYITLTHSACIHAHLVGSIDKRKIIKFDTVFVQGVGLY